MQMSVDNAIIAYMKIMKEIYGTESLKFVDIINVIMGLSSYSLKSRAQALEAAIQNLISDNGKLAKDSCET